MVSNIKNAFSVRTVLKKTVFFFCCKKVLKNEIEKLKIWWQTQGIPFFKICVMFFSNRKLYILTGLVRNF